LYKGYTQVQNYAVKFAVTWLYYGLDFQTGEGFVSSPKCPN